MGCKVSKLCLRHLYQPQRFTLTMWDVKEAVIPLSKQSFGRFYLNYVGCKGHLYLVENLTKLRFYLNYVGCKVSKLCLRHLYQPQRFTLTMWDVKEAVIPLSKQSFGRFYLNYVGCKGHLYLVENLTKLRFYLNYVGCKVLSSSLN